MNTKPNRRQFIGAASAAGVGLTFAWPGIARGAAGNSKPARLGGPKAHPGGYPGWPVFDSTEERALEKTLHGGRWYRGSGKQVVEFEDAYARLTGARHCVATSSGTAALTAALGAMDIGPGDEVLLPPYTFVATYNAAALNYALPVFVDIDLESFQIDANRIDSAVNEATRALLPVHIGGSPANLDAILEVADRRNIPVIEDACQAHLAEWRGRKAGSWGLAGCFSFQASKNLNSGEGGAVITGDDAFAEACRKFHHQGGGGKFEGAAWSSSGTRGTNLRLTEFQGSLLLAQMTRVVEQTDRRTKNAAYLTRMLKEIPGVQPAKLYDGTTRSAYHLYMFRYDRTPFAGLSRDRFLEALRAEGVPASRGYGVLNQSDYVLGLADNRHFKRLYGEKRMKEWREQTREGCPQNERLCREAVWLSQNVLLGGKEDMEQIAEAVQKIQSHGKELAALK